ncbi:MAG TPA: S-layer homology domain-containing protein [Anaerovoracaceae bacterium]|nr:S-layer homology domain-containing protein [Anaerovoracaceae bacterium]
MKKAIALAITFMTILASATVVYGAGYTDVKQGNWAYDAVNAMSEKAIIKGYPDGSFKPNNTVTYGEFIKMALIAGTGVDVGNSSSGNWATGYYNKALEMKYFTEYDIEKSQLGDKITRGDMALIISSILGDVKIENYDKIQEGIEDVTYQTEYEYDITKAYAYGILTGYSDNTFRPDKTLSRAESATVIYRLVDESKRVLPGTQTEGESSGYKLVNTAAYFDISTVANVRKLNPNDKYSTYGDFTEKAELYTDASGFDMKIHYAWDGEGCAFDHKLNGFIYLVKDGKIVEYCITTPRYDSEGNFLDSYGSMTNIDVTTVDYIIGVPSNIKTNYLVKIVPNPFK